MECIDVSLYYLFINLKTCETIQSTNSGTFSSVFKSLTSHGGTFLVLDSICTQSMSAMRHLDLKMGG